MSRTQLKRELIGMSSDQLIEVILDAYGARKEIKAYFDFFINPDVAKLKEKYFNAIQKELKRSKHGYCKARVSSINKLFKEFESFAPGNDAIADMYTLTISYVMRLDRSQYLSDTQYNWLSKTIERALVFADANECMDSMLEQFNTFLDTENKSYGSRSQRTLSNTINNYKQPLSPKNGR